MTRITQIEDRGAAVAWSPIKSHADVIALGAKVSYCLVFSLYHPPLPTSKIIAQNGYGFGYLRLD